MIDDNDGCSPVDICQMENTSLADSAAEYVPYEERPETYIVPVIFALIFLIGVLGNGTLVLIFARHRHIRNVPNTYIISLALGDLLVILTCVPFTSTMYTFESWPYGLLICKISEASKDISIGVSVFTLTVLSAERYCAISNPIQRRTSSKPATLATALSVWAVAIVLALPSAVFSNVRSVTLIDGREIEYCTPFPAEFGPVYSKSVVLFKFLAYYALPLCIIAWFYVMMARHLETTARNMPGEPHHHHDGAGGGAQMNQIRARRKVAKMVLFFVIMFVVCFLPYHLFMLWFHFYPSSEEDFNEFWNTFRIVAFCLSFINSCINPIALYFISGVFRKYFNRHLFVCWKHSSTSNGLENTASIRTTHSLSYNRRHNSVLTRQFTLSTTEIT